MFVIVFFVRSQKHNLISQLFENYVRHNSSPRHRPKWTFCNDLRRIIGAGCKAYATGYIGRLHIIANGRFSTRRFSVD